MKIISYYLFNDFPVRLRGSRKNISLIIQIDERKNEEMKKFEVKIQKVQENSIMIEARNKKEALKKAFDLVNQAAIQNIRLKNITKHYVVVDLGSENILNKNNRRCIDE